MRAPTPSTFIWNPNDKQVATTEGHWDHFAEWLEKVSRMVMSTPNGRGIGVFWWRTSRRDGQVIDASTL